MRLVGDFLTSNSSILYQFFFFYMEQIPISMASTRECDETVGKDQCYSSVIFWLFLTSMIKFGVVLQWVPAEVLTVEAGDRATQISVQTSLSPKVPLIVPAREVLLMDEHEDVDDVSDFTYLHEANLLNCITK